MGSRSVCIIGNLNIDIIIRHLPSLPIWGKEIVGDNHIVAPSGQAGYLGFALSELGIKNSIIGNVGDDYYGQMILKYLRAYKINTSGVEIIPNDKTCICVALCKMDGERAFVSDYASLSKFNKSFVYNNWNLLESSDIVCFVGSATLENFTLDHILEIAMALRNHKKMTVLDTGWYPNNFDYKTKERILSLLKYINIFLPNLDEANAITGVESPEEAAKVLQVYGAEIVVIKCGEKGSVARYKNKTYRIPAIPVKALDAVGAGDVYNSGFLLGIHNKYDIQTCMALGSAAAAIYISKENNRFPKLKDVIYLASTYYKEFNFELHNDLKG